MSANEELRERMAEQMEFVLSQTPEALAAENAKLREQIVELEKESGKLLKLARLVIDEFDQLRELAIDIVYRMPCKSSQLVKCRTCPRYRYPDGCMIGVRMRELGFITERVLQVPHGSA